MNGEEQVIISLNRYNYLLELESKFNEKLESDRTSYIILKKSIKERFNNLNLIIILFSRNRSTDRYTSLR